MDEENKLLIEKEGEVWDKGVCTNQRRQYDKEPGERMIYSKVANKTG